MAVSIDFGSVSLSEYTAELQRQVLRLDETDLLEPILDLGCGADAALVAYLYAAGREVVGVDRQPSSHPATRVADWLEVPLEPGKWGTVISHMGLSNQFLHHHLRPDGHPELYARRFMEVLASLVVGGRFLYSPGMPFLEKHLPRDRYAVSSFPVADAQVGEVRESLMERYGVDVLYACHVTRLG
jgi:SAM-dependent methyltransferase